MGYEDWDAIEDDYYLPDQLSWTYILKPYELDWGVRPSTPMEADDVLDTMLFIRRLP